MEEFIALLKTFNIGGETYAYGKLDCQLLRLYDNEPNLIMSVHIVEDLEVPNASFCFFKDYLQVTLNEDTYLRPYESEDGWIINTTKEELETREVAEAFEVLFYLQLLNDNEALNAIAASMKSSN